MEWWCWWCPRCLLSAAQLKTELASLWAKPSTWGFLNINVLCLYVSSALCLLAVSKWPELFIIWNIRNYMRCLYKDECSEQVMLAHAELDALRNVVKTMAAKPATTGLTDSSTTGETAVRPRTLLQMKFLHEGCARRIDMLHAYGRRRTRLFPEGIAWSTLRTHFNNVWNETPTSNRCAVSMQTFFACAAEGKHPGKKKAPEKASFTCSPNYFWPLLETY